MHIQSEAFNCVNWVFSACSGATHLTGTEPL